MLPLQRLGWQGARLTVQTGRCARLLRPHCVRLGPRPFAQWLSSVDRGWSLALLEQDGVQVRHSVDPAPVDVAELPVERVAAALLEEGACELDFHCNAPPCAARVQQFSVRRW